MRFSCLIFLFIFIGLAVRLFFIQVLQGLNYLELAQRQFHTKEKLEFFRGGIYDRNGQVLATTVQSQSFYLDTKDLSKTNHLGQFLQAHFSSNFSQIKKKLNSDNRFIWLDRKLNPLLAEKIACQNVKGLGIVSEQKRYYPNGYLACHLIGTVGLDNRGLSGIEQGFNSFLTGKSFVLSHLHDGRGRKIFSSTDNKSEILDPAVSVHSNSLLLTIDRSLQFIAEKEIRQGVEENEAQSGTVIIQNPHTGEILAMASYPGFDPNKLARGEVSTGFKNSELQNFAVSKLFEPGSTFKAITFSAAIEEKKCALNEKFFCEDGKWEIAGQKIRDHEPSGNLTFAEVLEKSSNIGTAKIGLKLGKNLLYQYARAFGFGTKSGIPIPGEIEGLLRIPQKWSGTSLAVISFGQEIGVTAVQLVNAYSVIANGGFLMEPLIVKEIIKSKEDDTSSNVFLPRKVRRVISVETAEKMRGLLQGVVEKGTGAQAKFSGYTVAGKTGTAQKIDPKTKKYYPDKYIASFCGFVPAGNPQLVCLVMLDEPKKDYWGGSTSAPIFSRIMSRAVQILGVPPQTDSTMITTKLDSNNSKNRILAYAGN